MDLSAYFYDRRTGLCDCDNFFVSCERSVHPEFENVPVAVLSANDGCIISRSNEVKAMGIKMGVPYYQVKNFLHARGVKIFSGNMALYREISHKVMACLREFSDSVEQYSVDEAFFNLAVAAVTDPVAYCRALRRAVRSRCGVPVSIGIAPTKTLCKLGAEYAKKHKETGGVFWLDKKYYRDAKWMGMFETGDVWGIGYHTARKLLERRGVRTAADLTMCDDLWLKKNFGTGLLLTAWELRGHPASHVLIRKSSPQSIQVSRTFGHPVRNFADLLDPLLCFSVSAARQLRRAQLSARRIHIYIRTSPFGDGYFYRSADHEFKKPEFLDSVFMGAVREMLKNIFEPDRAYKKAGVYLNDFYDRSVCAQQFLFYTDDARMKRAAEAADTINSELGISAVKPAMLFSAPGKKKLWRPNAELSDGAKPGQENSAFDGMRFMSHAMNV
jgi:DNA polymerase V